MGPPSWHPGLSLQACQRSTGCERAETHQVREGGAWLGPGPAPHPDPQSRWGGSPSGSQGPLLPICSATGGGLPTASACHQLQHHASSHCLSVLHLTCGPPHFPRTSHVGTMRGWPPGAFPSLPPHASGAAGPGHTASMSGSHTPFLRTQQKQVLRHVGFKISPPSRLVPPGPVLQSEHRNHMIRIGRSLRDKPRACDCTRPITTVAFVIPGRL